SCALNCRDPTKIYTLSLHDALPISMISGRGLGATGGTLDKLEAIPGFRTNLSLDEMRDVVERVGCVINGATETLVPADRRLYALDRKSTRLNSSHVKISYAVFCLKK